MPTRGSDMSVYRFTSTLLTSMLERSSRSTQLSSDTVFLVRFHGLAADLFGSEIILLFFYEWLRWSCGDEEVGEWSPW